MPPKLALAVFGASLCLAAVAIGQDQAGDTKSQMEFRMFAAPESVFSTVDPTDREGARKPNPGVRLIKGKKNEFDVREFLAKYGISFPAGSMAVYDGALMVRNTAENVALVDRIFGNAPPADSAPGVSIQISTYECTLPASGKVLPWDELTFADIAKLPPGSAKLVDTNLILNRSGQRCRSYHLIDPRHTDVIPPQFQAQAAPPDFHDGETGSLLETEPVIGPDDVTVDLNIYYHLRVPLADGDHGCAELNFLTAVTTWSGYPLVLHTAPVANEPGKYFVVVALAKVGDMKEFELPPPEPGVKPGVVDARESDLELPPHMILKRYNVPPGFLAAFGGSGLAPGAVPSRHDVNNYLQDSGVTFPEGSETFFNPATSSLVIINTKENLALVDRIVNALNNTTPIQASAELSAYECDFSDAKDTAAHGEFTFADLEKMPRDSVKVIDCVSLITKSGERAETYDAAQPDVSKGAGFVAGDGLPDGEAGTLLSVEPVIGPDGKKIDTDLSFTIQTRTGGAGGKEITKINKNLFFPAEAGTPRVVMVSPVRNEDGKYIVVVARLRTLSPAGRTVKFDAPPLTPMSPPSGTDAAAPGAAVTPK